MLGETVGLGAVGIRRDIDAVPPAATERLKQGRRVGKPRGLRWTQCEWGDAVELARDPKSGQLLAFVSVTISFEAIVGSDMEGLPAVANLRNASAVFFFDGSEWHTDGRAVFNLNPDEAIRHFGKQYQRVDGSEKK